MYTVSVSPRVFADTCTWCRTTQISGRLANQRGKEKEGGGGGVVCNIVPNLPNLQLSLILEYINN